MLQCGRCEGWSASSLHSRSAIRPAPGLLSNDPEATGVTSSVLAAGNTKLALALNQIDGVRIIDNFKVEFTPAKFDIIEIAGSDL